MTVDSCYFVVVVVSSVAGVCVHASVRRCALPLKIWNASQIYVSFFHRDRAYEVLTPSQLSSLGITFPDKLCHYYKERVKKLQTATEARHPRVFLVLNGSKDWK